MNKSKKVSKMEMLLRYIEDYLWFMCITPFNHSLGKNTVNGHLPHPNELRRALHDNNFPKSKWVYDLLLNWKGHAYEYINSNLCLYISNLGDWFFNSKRIFSLSENLVDLLIETDLPEFIPSDTTFVADTFAIQLEKPIEFEKGMFFDLIIVSRDPELHYLSVTAYPSALNDYEPLTQEQKKTILRKRDRGQRVFADIFNDFVDKKSAIYGNPCGFTVVAQEGQTYKQTIESEIGKKFGIESLEMCSKLFQIALGLNLYIQTKKTSADTEVVTKTPRSASDRGRDIGSDVDLFTFSSSYMMHRNSGSSAEGCEGEGVRPHFRRGFWRRPKGSGHDSTVQPTEWVRPTWVRLDKILKGEKAIGSHQTVMVD